MRNAAESQPRGGDSTWGLWCSPRVRKAKWWEQPQALSLRHRPAERPQMAVNLMAEQLAAHSPFSWASSPPADQGQPSRETLKTQIPTGSTHWHAYHTDTHTRTSTTHATKTLPASGQSPSSESLPQSLVQAEGRGEAASCPGLDLVQRLQQVVACEGAGLQGAVGPAGKGTCGSGAQVAAERGAISVARNVLTPLC